MFQYAAGRALASRHGVPLAFDSSWYEQAEHQRAVPRSFDLMNFAVQGQMADSAALRPFCPEDGGLMSAGLLGRFRRRLTGRSVWRFDAMGYSTEFERLGAKVLLEGYFQDPRFFEPVQSALHIELRLRAAPTPEVSAYAAELSQRPTVCIQVRRTDFVANERTAAIHGVCDPGYFQKAWALVRGRVPGAQGVVFSDDVVWAGAAFSGWKDVTVAGPEWNGPAYLHKFHLMQSCRHFIIANSTWGWWAAWLCRFPDKTVIMPERWFLNETLNTAAAGLCLPGWIRC